VEADFGIGVAVGDKLFKMAWSCLDWLNKTWQTLPMNRIWSKNLLAKKSEYFKEFFPSNKAFFGRKN
jgi:hypothetical protein